MAFMLITSHYNWDRLAEARYWVFDRPRKIITEALGQRAVVYLTAHGGPSSIGGVVKLGDEVQEGSDDVLSSLYPFRVPLRVEVQLRSPIAIDSIRERLSFFPKKSNWGSVLQGQPIKRIPEEDFDLMTAAIEGHPSAVHPVAST